MFLSDKEKMERELRGMTKERLSTQCAQFARTKPLSFIRDLPEPAQTEAINILCGFGNHRQSLNRTFKVAPAKEGEPVPISKRTVVMVNGERITQITEPVSLDAESALVLYRQHGPKGTGKLKEVVEAPVVQEEPAKASVGQREKVFFNEMMAAQDEANAAKEEAEKLKEEAAAAKEEAEKLKKEASSQKGQRTKAENLKKEAEARAEAAEQEAAALRAQLAELQASKEEKSGE
jgi:flagellar biosynthesis GTPase FlhF